MVYMEDCLDIYKYYQESIKYKKFTRPQDGNAMTLYCDASTIGDKGKWKLNSSSEKQSCM